MNRDAIELGHVLAAYAESRLSSGAVLFVGDVESGVAERLLDLGARQVHAFDRDGARAKRFSEKADRRIVARPLPHKFEVRDSAFDVAIVVDMASAPDPESLARELARLVKQDGIVIAATANADADPTTARGERASRGSRESSGSQARGIPYEAFYDLFAVAFEHVRVAAKASWRGALLAELGERGEDPDVTVDSALAPEPPTPTHFVIIASQAPSDLDAYALYQLPLIADEERDEVEEIEVDVDSFEDFGPISQSETVAGPRAEAAAAAAIELLQSRLRAEAAANELLELRRINDAQTLHLKELLEERARHAVVAADLARVAQDFAHAQNELKKAANARDEHAREYAREIVEVKRAAEHAAAHAAAESAIAHAAELAEAVKKSAEQSAESTASRAEEIARGVAIAVAQAVEKHGQQAAEEHAADLARVELQLRDRARMVSELEREVLRRERLVRELVGTLEDAHDAREAHAKAAHPTVPLAAPSPTIEPPPIASSASSAVSASTHIPMQDLEKKLAAVAFEMARYEGELLARDWRIAELEQNLAIADSAVADANHVTELETELDTLRRAFAQEHQEKAALADALEKLEKMQKLGEKSAHS